MKTKIITLTWITLLFLIVNSDTFGSPYIRFAKPSHRSAYKMSIAEMTQNLHFGFAKANFNSKYNDQLDQLAKALIDGDYAVVLRGHADSIGTYVGNWKLSQKRADSIKGYLMKKGVADRKIVTTPLGSTTPIATNKTREGRQKNRRVEIKITKVNS